MGCETSSTRASARRPGHLAEPFPLGRPRMHNRGNRDPPRVRRVGVRGGPEMKRIVGALLIVLAAFVWVIGPAEAFGGGGRGGGGAHGAAGGFGGGGMRGGGGSWGGGGWHG